MWGSKSPAQVLIYFQSACQVRTFFCIHRVLFSWQASHTTPLTLLLCMLYKSFQRKEGKNPTNCLLGFILFLWRRRRPSKDCKSCRNYLQSLAVSSRSSILCLGTAVSGNKFHSLDPPKFVLGVPNQDITENMSAITNVGLCCDIKKNWNVSSQNWD